MSKTKPEQSKTLTAAEVEGAGVPDNTQLEELLAKAEADAKAAADDRAAAENAKNEALAKVKEAEDFREQAKAGQETADNLMKDLETKLSDADARAKEIVSKAEKKAADIAAEADDKAEEVAKAEAAKLVEDAETKAAKIIADAEDNAEAIRAEKARLAEVETKAKDAKDAVKKREADKKKRAKAKERALKKPQTIKEDDMPAALLLASELGDMPTDISALQSRLVQINGAEFDGDAPIHTVKIYGLTVSGPAGFHSALKNWAAAVRRIAKDAA